MTADNSRLVYSTDRPVKSREKAGKKSIQIQPCLPPAEQKVTVRHDRKKRGGKSVTVIDGLQLPQNDLKTLLKTLKTMIGTGGAVKESSIEIQGEHCALIISRLENMGYRPKQSGR